jgi:hypothetical protein
MLWNQMHEIERETLRSEQNKPKEKPPSKPPKGASLPVTNSAPASSLQEKTLAKRGVAAVTSRISVPQSNTDPSSRRIQTARRSALFGMSRIASTSKTEAPSRPKQTASRGGHSGMSGMHALPVEDKMFRSLPPSGR